MGNFDKVVEAGRGFVCELYRIQPGALIPNPISDGLRLAWDSLCGDDVPTNLPPPPTPPFVGGQCECVQYLVTVEITYAPNETDPNYEQSIESTKPVVGKVKGLRSRELGNLGSNLPYQAVDIIASRGLVSGVCNQSDVFVEAYRAPRVKRFRIRSITRLDNLSDTCGNPPSSYPTSPTPPGEGYTSSPVSLTYNDGSDYTIIFNLKPPSGNGLGPPPICLTTHIGGVVFEVCYPFGGVPQIRGVDGIESLIRELQEDFRGFQEEYNRDNRPLPPDEDPSLTPLPLEGVGGGEEDVEGLRWLVVTLTKLPQKAQFGNPTVFFAGWVTFKLNGAYTERQQLSYERSVFQAPEGATGYGVTFTNLSEGNVVSYATQ